MQSAAVIAHQYKEQAAAEASDGEDTLPITTPGASIAKDGKTYLRGNPLSTTAEVLCSNCRLPRLRHPVTGKNAREPETGREYCAKQPYIEKEGCDIYGNSLDLEKPNRNPKGAKDAKSKKKADESPDGSQSNSLPSSKPSDKPTSIPYGKCPNCSRYLAVTRIAQHLDKCMGISGRQSSKNALSKMNTGTPRDSRATTPKPQLPNTKKRKAEKGTDDESGEDAMKKKKKKLISKKQKESTGKAVNSSLARVKSAEKRLPGQSDSGREKTPVKEKDDEE